jgi:hypothetical protein
MSKLLVVGLGLIALSLTGCPQAVVAPGTTPVHVVVDQIKSELNYFTTQKADPGRVHAGSCTSKAAVDMKLVSAQLVLKVTAGETFSGNLSGEIPAGSVVTIKPAADVSYATTKTQTLTLDLGFDVAAVLRGQIEALRKEIDAETKEAAAAVGRDDEKKDEKSIAPAKAPCEPAPGSEVGRPTCEALMKRVADQKLRVLELGRALARPEPEGQHDTTVAAQPHPIADALIGLRNELLEVKHDAPCFKPTQLKVQVDFEVVRKADGGADIVLFKIITFGGKAEYSNDRLQSLILTFDLADSTAQLK